MCAEHERLIGFLYDECDAAERHAIEAHLEQCAECRDEVQALKRVRADLLAWDVPGTPQIWRPLTSASAQPWWRQVPAWALAAAAGLVIASGLTGALAARVLVPAGTQAAVEAAPPAAVPVGVTPADLAAVQERILDLVKFEMDQRAARGAVTQSVRYVNPPASADLTRQIGELNRAYDQYLRALSALYNDVVGYQDRTDAKLKVLQTTTESLAAAMNQSR